REYDSSFDPNLFNKIGSVNVHGNSITGLAQGKFAIVNPVDPVYTKVIDATCNWYGTEVASAISAMISGPVDFLPFLVVDNLIGTSYWWDNTDDYLCSGCDTDVVAYIVDTDTYYCSL
ncbi:hypothetical protein RZS08_61570, partial [Arthrospira platensis SPKY1]|nr:hypothetical protein [Arthrospira platensis SPKY1]